MSDVGCRMSDVGTNAYIMNMLFKFLQWLKSSPWWFFGDGEIDGFRGHNEHMEKRQRRTKFDKRRIKRKRR